MSPTSGYNISTPSTPGCLNLPHTIFPIIVFCFQTYICSGWKINWWMCASSWIFWSIKKKPFLRLASSVFRVLKNFQESVQKTNKQCSKNMKIRKDGILLMQLEFVPPFCAQTWALITYPWLFFFAFFFDQGLSLPWHMG